MFLIIGAGSIGRRHIQNLNALGYSDLDVADIDSESLRAVKRDFHVKETFQDYRKAIAAKRYDAAFILAPTSLHIPIAIDLARHGTSMFIEKPLGTDMTGIRELVRIKEERGLTAMVGYNQRFNYGIRTMKAMIDRGDIGKVYYIRAESGQYLPDWRPRIDYRKSYSAIKALGGGIMLDGSHELDYVAWLSGGSIRGVKAAWDKVSGLDVNVEDIAEFILTFEGGLMASIHLNMVERGYNRYCKVMGEKGSIKWTFRENTLEHYDGDSGKLTVEKYTIDPNQSYMDELRHFIGCLEDGREPLSNLYTAKTVLEAIMRVKKEEEIWA